MPPGSEPFSGEKKSGVFSRLENCQELAQLVPWPFWEMHRRRPKRITWVCYSLTFHKNAFLAFLFVCLFVFVFVVVVVVVVVVTCFCSSKAGHFGGRMWLLLQTWKTSIIHADCLSLTCDIEWHGLPTTNYCTTYLLFSTCQGVKPVQRYIDHRFWERQIKESFLK